MGRGQKTKQNLLAKSRLSKIGFFSPEMVTWSTVDGQPAAIFKSVEYLDFTEKLTPVTERIIRDFPIIFRDNGQPWDLGNLYLLRYFYEAAKTSEPSMVTLKAKAKSLTIYLRWIESMQRQDQNISALHFPEDPLDRVTYRYKRYLQRLLRQSPQVISLTTAKENMSQVIQFYRGIITWGIVEQENIRNRPFKESEVSIHYTTGAGMKAIKSALTTDLSFHIPKSGDVDHTAIQDGERLIPLNLREQSIVLEHLNSYGNRTFEMMVHVAFRTGARLQTVSTLRICELRTLAKQKPNKYGEVRLTIGDGCLTDMKGERKYHKRSSLFIPLDLVEELLEYADCEMAQTRRQMSFYGDSDENYVFLNAKGSPFYTSHKEMMDRANPDYSKRISLRDRMDFPIANGQAVNNLMARLKASIYAKHPEFRNWKFHDLRATYGMNFIREWLEAGKNVNVGVGELRVRMGHRSIQTTFQYLNYGSEVEGMTELEDLHFDSLNGRSPS